MSTVDHHERPARDGAKLIAQAIVLTVLVIAAAGVFWLYVSDQAWYLPAMALIVLARFTYDRFFAAG